VLTPLVDELLQHVQLLHSTLTVLDDASDAQLQLLRLYEDAILNARDGVLEALLREAARQLHAVGVPSYESYQYVAQTLFNALGVALSHRVIKYDGLCDTFSISGQPVPRTPEGATDADRVPHGWLRGRRHSMLVDVAVSDTARRARAVCNNAS
jgi:hypothetical protein